MVDVTVVLVVLDVVAGVVNSLVVLATVVVCSAVVVSDTVVVSKVVVTF